MPILLKLFQNIAEDGTFPNSFYKATITLIPKPDKDNTKHTSITDGDKLITNRMIKKKHVIISIDAEKAFDKIQHPSMIKTLPKMGTEGT